MSVLKGEVIVCVVVLIGCIYSVYDITSIIGASSSIFNGSISSHSSGPYVVRAILFRS